MKKVFLLFSFLIYSGLNAQTVDLTFQIDMRIEMAKENFSSGSNQVELRGSFDGWGAGLVLSDGNNDSVYTVTLTGQPQNTVIFYKFFHTGNEGSWESDPNREVNTGTSTATLDPYFFDGRTPYTGVQSPVTFNVDMRLPARGNFDPATNHVYVAGNFTNWADGAIEMTDPDGDSTFSVEVNTLTSGDLAIYKFIWSTGAANIGNWESPTGSDVFGNDNNRIYGIVDGNNDVTRFWNNTDPNITLANGNILFRVDMTVMNQVGIWNSITDTVQVRGDFNGWSANDPERSIMNQDFLNENIWELNVPFVQQPLNLEMFYKFFVDVENAGTNWLDGWERPVRIGGGNRGVIFQGQPNQEIPTLLYDDILPEWIINPGTNLQVVFTVDMTYAMDPDTQPVAFNPATDTVYWISEQPAFQVTQGWNTDGRIRAVPMTLQAGNIYIGTLSIQDPSFNGFEYRYGYSSDGNIIYEEAGFGQFAYRVRYAAMNGPNTFPVNPYPAPLDTWTNSPIKVNETPPLSVVNEIDINPDGYVLEQNYPNPFNPATKIRFGVPEQGLVSLKVYNALGQEVETLINYEMQVGTYEAVFDAKNLSSGVYFYTIKAGSFTSSKKMLLLK
jgi:hypothetical protein